MEEPDFAIPWSRNQSHRTRDSVIFGNHCRWKREMDRIGSWTHVVSSLDDLSVTQIFPCQNSVAVPKIFPWMTDLAESGPQTSRQTRRGPMFSLVEVRCWTISVLLRFFLVRVSPIITCSAGCPMRFQCFPYKLKHTFQFNNNKIYLCYPPDPFLLPNKPPPVSSPHLSNYSSSLFGLQFWSDPCQEFVLDGFNRCYPISGYAKFCKPFTWSIHGKRRGWWRFAPPRPPSPPLPHGSCLRPRELSWVLSFHKISKRNDGTEFGDDGTRDLWVPRFLDWSSEGWCREFRGTMSFLRFRHHGKVDTNGRYGWALHGMGWRHPFPEFPDMGDDGGASPRLMDGRMCVRHMYRTEHVPFQKRIQKPNSIK